MAPGCTVLLNLRGLPGARGSHEARLAFSSIWLLDTHAHMHTRAHPHTPPAKFSLHVWKVKPGVSVSLLI